MWAVRLWFCCQSMGRQAIWYILAQMLRPAKAQSLSALHSILVGISSWYDKQYQGITMPGRIVPDKPLQMEALEGNSGMRSSAEVHHQWDKASGYVCRRKAILLLTQMVITANQDSKHTGNSLWQCRWWGRALTSAWAEANNGNLKISAWLTSHWFMCHRMRQGEVKRSSYRFYFCPFD